MRSDSDQNKALIAKVSFYTALSQNRAAPYLPRNLTRVLDCHERQRMRERAHAPSDAAAAARPPPGSATTTITTTTATTRTAWAFPRLSDGMMRDLIKGHAPVLTITALSLRPAEGAKEGANRAERARSGGPSWLPRPNELQLPCQVTVAVYDLRAGRKAVYLDLRQGAISETRGGGGGDDDGFEISLSEPFRITEDKMTMTTSTAAESGPWKREFVANTGLEFGIQFLRSSDAAEFLSEIEGRDRDGSEGPPQNEGILRALWTNLPEIPGAGDLLPLKRTRGHKRVDLRYGVKPKMGWNQPRSPVVCFNQALQHARNEPRQLLTPSSEDMDEPAMPCTIKYLFTSQFRMRSAVTHDLKCLLCPNGPEHSSFERLHLHFLTHHAHLQFEVDDSNEESDETKLVRISAEESRQAPAESEMNWQAPAKAFDIVAHLGGNSTWDPYGAPQSRNRGVAKTVSARSKGRSIRTAGEQPSELVSVHRAKRKILPPDEVEDLPPRLRRKHEVPSVPGINFYRTASKRRVQPGTLLNESDEEPDESWFEQASRYHLAELGMDQISRDFNETFNKHLSVERPMSDSLTRDAVVRFTRKFKSKLADPRWTGRFRAKLRQLESRLVIGEDTVEYCLKILATEDDDNNNATGATASLETPRQERSSSGINGETTASPTRTQFGSGSRMRSENGRTSSADDIEATPTQKKTKQALGERMILCNWTNEDMEQTEQQVVDLVNFWKRPPYIPADEIQPHHVRFSEFWDSPYRYSQQGVYSVALSIINGMRRPITDQEEWHNAIVQAHEETEGPIEFEICPEELVEQRCRDMNAKRLSEIELREQSDTPKAQLPETQVSETGLRRCTCGEQVSGVRGIIACSNVACGGEYHMACVQLRKRPMDWRCGHCTTA